MLINTIKQVSRESDIQFFSFAQVLGYVYIDKSPSAAFESWIGLMHSYFLSGGDGCTVFSQNLKMTLNGFTCHGHGVIEIVAG